MSWELSFWNKMNRKSICQDLYNSFQKNLLSKKQRQTSALERDALVSQYVLRIAKAHNKCNAQERISNRTYLHQIQ